MRSPFIFGIAMGLSAHSNLIAVKKKLHLFAIQIIPHGPFAIMLLSLWRLVSYILVERGLQNAYNYSTYGDLLWLTY